MYHRLDDNHIEVLAGDIPKGLWTYADSRLSLAESKDPVTVELARNIKALTVRLKRNVSNFDTVSDMPGSPMVGMALGALGPLGGIASNLLHAVAGSSEFVCIGCELSDGRKFIARMRAEIYKRWEKLK